ncbi:MAG: pseudouridine synthase [Oscillospiraceae bacterium]|nr:pseudouridine synthase [Oscillospiraceae bacterium]
MRLDKFLSEANVASRKAIKQMIKEARVRVDGVPAKSPDQKIDEHTSQVMVDGKEIRLGGRIVLMLHKPAGFVTSTSDPRDRTVMELLPAEYQKLFPVGRLDKETEGMLLFTNDGELGHRLTAPKHQVEKRYYAETDGQPDEKDAEAFRQGIILRDGTKCLPAELEPFPGGCYVTVREGKYHQVRRMLASRGKPVTYLRREMEGGLKLGGLRPGEFRILQDEEVINLL